MPRWIKSRTRLAHSWTRPAKVMSSYAVESRCSWLRISEQAASLKRQRLVSQRRFQNRQADLLVGRMIGHYKLSERIGSGGMGEVYLATDIRAGRKAALKLLPTRFTGDAERLKRFQQEARVLVGLNHPNILTVYEIGEDDSTHYIASELIEGETLRQRLMHGRMELSEAVDVAIQVAASSRPGAGIVLHIKPRTSCPAGWIPECRLWDCKLAEQEAPQRYRQTKRCCWLRPISPILESRYMSPEQACGGQVDPTTDI